MDTSAPIRASLDGRAFEFDATGNGNRVVVSTGMKKLLDQKYWIPIQKTCPDLQPADNNRDSVPTKWLIEVTANPPTFVKPRHRLTLRMVHLICLDALAEGANFRSDKVFARETPVLQVERNVLESPEHWEPGVEVSTASAKGQNKRRAWHGLAWPGMAWHGLAWLGTAWHGLAWLGMAWHGLAWPDMTWNGLT